MSLTTCFSCGLPFSHVESSCPHCARRTRGGVLRSHASAEEATRCRRIAMVASVVVPGAGHVYLSKRLQGFIWFAIIVFGYLMNVSIGAMMHALCVCATYEASVLTAVRSRGSESQAGRLT